MKPQTLNPPFQTVFEEEISAIANFYNLESQTILQTIMPLLPWLENYWEMVFATESLEIITAGKGPDFAEKVATAALHQGLSTETVNLFLQGCQAFPEVIYGIKWCFSASQKTLPTIYIRTKTEIKSGLNFLENHLPAADIQVLKSALQENKTLYGLGFSEKHAALYVKTYTIENVVSGKNEVVPGFVSHRLHQGQLSKEHKTYLPEVSLYEFQPEVPALKNLRDFLLFRMQYSQAGHIGMLHQEEVLTEYKIYVERLGGIPTDFSAR